MKKWRKKLNSSHQQLSYSLLLEKCEIAYQINWMIVSKRERERKSNKTDIISRFQNRNKIRFTKLFYYDSELEESVFKVEIQ